MTSSQYDIEQLNIKILRRKNMIKKILSIVMVLCLLSATVFAAGSWVLTSAQPGSERMWKQFTGTADSGDGSLPAYTVVGFGDYYLYSVETWSGAVTPTDDSDFTLLDATTGEDLLGANGTDAIDGSNPNSIFPKSTNMDLNFYHVVKGNMTINVTNNSVTSAIIHIRITGVR